MDGDGDPPEFPEAPEWGFESESDVLNAFFRDAEDCLRDPDKNSEDEADLWDILCSAAYVILGPSEPLFWGAMSRSALAAARMPGGLAAAAALAAGAAEGMYMAAVDAAGCPDSYVDTFLAEAEFAVDVLAAARGRLGKMPGRSPEGPFPAPAFRLSAARCPGIAPGGGPSPGELLTALETAEHGHGPGSHEALAALSRLGAAVADEEARSGSPWPGWDAWKARSAGKAGSDGGDRAEAGKAGSDGGDRAEAGKAGSDGGDRAEAGRAGEASAEALLRSASGGLDALLGRTHPDSLDARERLARFLAGGSGPGLPLADPLPSELPAEGALLEAMDMFLETAWARAAASQRAKGSSGGPGPEAVAAPWTPELLERLPALLRLSRDQAAFAAAASAAECDMMLGGFPSERSDLLAEAGKAAGDLLGEAHPAAVRFRTCDAAVLEARKKADEAHDILARAVLDLETALGASAREKTRAAVRAGRNLQESGDFPNAIPYFCEALQTLEVPVPSALHFRRGSFRSPELPPGPAGRDILALRLRVAQCLMGEGDAPSALDTLGPLLDSLPRLPPARGGPGDWPWPAELAGRALGLAGEAHLALGETEKAEKALRSAAAAFGQEPADLLPPRAALSRLAEILGGRGDPDSLREAAGLAEREAGLWARAEGPGSSAAAGRLLAAAEWLEAAGDAAAALSLRRKALA